MIRKHYSGLMRRAENMIWNAAGRYDFDPPFMAFMENGSPDDYFNTVIGLAVKWFDIEKISDFFDSLSGSRKAEEFTEILWLGLENCLYEKELPERPALVRLRGRRAKLFYESRETLSRQQMMLQSMLVYDQMEARWAFVLGRKGGKLTPREKRLSEALVFSGELDTAGAIREMSGILREYFRYTPSLSDSSADALSGTNAKAAGGRRGILKKLLKREDHYRDSLIVRTGTGTGDAEGSAQLTREAGDRKSVRDYEKDLAYIRGTLGESAVSERELRTLENDLCIGNHTQCRLWITEGKERAGEALKHAERNEIERFNRERAAQQQKNAAYRLEHQQLLVSSIRKLSARMDEILSSSERTIPEEGRRGRLEPEKAYRLPVLKDPDVFVHPGDEAQRNVTVDLLLDASASRLNYQELLASEAYVIAKSFEGCRVPVQVECFRSLRGFTVLQILKKREDRSAEGIFSYTAGGWNRDGLGIRLAGRFLPEDRNRLRILIVLTDASPNDSTRMPAENGSIFEREYQGKRAVLDTKQAVEELRKDGVRTAAIFLGPTLYLENLHTVYGKECVRIHRMEQLSDAVSGLLEMILREEQRTQDSRSTLR